MPLALSRQLEDRIESDLPFLRAVSEEAAGRKPTSGGWSPKEELGHLIDSAINNHTRFVTAGIGSEYRGPGYAQDEWVRLHGYSEVPWEKLVSWWFAQNQILVQLIARIPEEKLANLCHIGAHPVASLRFIIEDYGVHLQHHVDHLLSRPVITPYPQA
jgi:hypothetical protein